MNKLILSINLLLCCTLTIRCSTPKERAFNRTRIGKSILKKEANREAQKQHKKQIIQYLCSKVQYPQITPLANLIPSIPSELKKSLPNDKANISPIKIVECKGDVPCINDTFTWESTDYFKKSINDNSIKSIKKSKIKIA